MVVIKDIDMGWNNLIRESPKIDGLTVSAGILDDAGTFSNGKKIVDVAAWNEYGTKHIPSRPFIRIASDENKNAWEKLAKECADKISSGSISANEAGEIMGKRMVKDIQKVFGDKSKLKPNAPATIKRKGHDKPLIVTGKLRDAVDYRVEGTL